MSKKTIAAWVEAPKHAEAPMAHHSPPNNIEVHLQADEAPPSVADAMVGSSSPDAATAANHAHVFAGLGATPPKRASGAKHTNTMAGERKAAMARAVWVRLVLYPLGVIQARQAAQAQGLRH